MVVSSSLFLSSSFFSFFLLNIFSLHYSQVKVQVKSSKSKTEGYNLMQTILGGNEGYGSMKKLLMCVYEHRHSLWLLFSWQLCSSRLQIGQCRREAVLSVPGLWNVAEVRGVNLLFHIWKVVAETPSFSYCFFFENNLPDTKVSIQSFSFFFFLLEELLSSRFLHLASPTSTSQEIA